jgi:hypothetical protein
MSFTEMSVLFVVLQYAQRLLARNQLGQVLIYPINKMYDIPEKNRYQMIKLKYTV